MNALRGAWRLLRVLGHVLQGLLILAMLFPRRDAVGRQWHIQRWSAGLLRALGLKLTVHQQGTVPRAALIVANHVSWLDIACVHAALPQARFVSKADVRAWPLIGWMVAAARHLVHRARAQARRAARRAPLRRGAEGGRHGGRVPRGHHGRWARCCCPSTPTCCSRR